MKITVLLSSYNGEKYISEQIDSILAQDVKAFAELTILVRDDGSKDKTHDILDEYQKKGLLKWYTGDNLRPAKSFWNLVNTAKESDYYAFCDQDDVWKKDKLSRAIKSIQSNREDEPVLYCSAVTVVDECLNPTGHMSKSYSAKNDFAYSLLYNISPGCTFVFNELARKELIKYDISEEFVIIHDWLAYKIIAMKGIFIHDKEETMLYRQHGNNVIGSQGGGIKGFVLKVKRFMNGKSNGVRSGVAKSLLKVYGGEISADFEKMRLLTMVANYREDKKLKKAFLKEKAFCVGGYKDKFLRLLIRLGKI